jgi:hypothetical protein
VFVGDVHSGHHSVLPHKTRSDCLVYLSVQLQYVLTLLLLLPLLLP